MRTIATTFTLVSTHEDGIFVMSLRVSDRLRGPFRQVPHSAAGAGDNRPAQWPDCEGRRGVSEVEHQRGCQCPRHFCQPGSPADRRGSATSREAGARLAAQRRGCEEVPGSTAGPAGAAPRAGVELTTCHTLPLESNMCSLALAPGKTYGRGKGV